MEKQQNKKHTLWTVAVNTIMMKVAPQRTGTDGPQFLAAHTVVIMHLICVL